MEDFVFYIRSLIEPHCENFDSHMPKSLHVCFPNLRVYMSVFLTGMPNLTWLNLT